MMSKIKSEEAPEYITIPDIIADQTIINDALEILRLRIRKPDTYITSPSDTRNYLKLKIAELEHEVFGCLILDNRHGIISDKVLFTGTIDGASVYPREVVKAVLSENGAAIIMYHNHPSGVSEQSTADEQITIRIKKALALIDVRVLDHIIVGNDSVTSFAEKGLL